MRRLWWLLLVLPVAQGATVGGAFDSVEAQFIGHAEGQMEVAALVLHPALAPAVGTITLRIEGGVVHHLRTLDVSLGVSGQPSVMRSPGPEQLVESMPIDGVLLVRPSPETHVRVLAPHMSGAMSMPLQNDASQWSAGPDDLIQSDDPRGTWHDSFARPAWPLGQSILTTGQPTETTLDRPHYVYVYGAMVESDAGTWRTGQDTHAASPGGEAATSSHDYLVIESSNTAISWGTSPAILVRQASFHVDGQARFLKADGELLLDGEATSKNRQLVILNGTFHMEVAANGGQQQWRVEGIADAVAIDGVDVLDGTTGRLLAVSALTAAAIALAIWSGILHKLAGLVLGHRLDDPLRHPARAALARALLWQPGQSHMDLAKAHALSRKSVRFHIGLLVAAGMVSEHRDGKIPRYALNSGSSRFAQDSVSAADAFAAQAHPVRRQILEAAYHDAVDYATFLKFVGHPLPESTFRHHCRILADAGLLEQTKQGRQSAWSLAQDPEAMRQHYVRAFLVQQGLWSAYQNAQQGEVHDRRAWQALERLGLVESASLRPRSL